MEFRDVVFEKSIEDLSEYREICVGGVVIEKCSDIGIRKGFGVVVGG